MPFEFFAKDSEAEICILRNGQAIDSRSFKMFTFNLPAMALVLSFVLWTSGARSGLTTARQEETISKQDYCNNSTVNTAPNCWDELEVTQYLED